jgi:hypothetical protein
MLSIGNPVLLSVPVFAAFMIVRGDGPPAEERHHPD